LALGRVVARTLRRRPGHLIAAQVRWQKRHGASAHRDEFAMLTAGRTGVGKQRRECLALSLIEAFALRHHVGHLVAKIWWQTSSRLGWWRQVLRLSQRSPWASVLQTPVLNVPGFCRLVFLFLCGRRGSRRLGCESYWDATQERDDEETDCRGEVRIPIANWLSHDMPLFLCGLYRLPRSAS
jgi:hypothetical protein